MPASAVGRKSLVRQCVAFRTTAARAALCTAGLHAGSPASRVAYSGRCPCWRRTSTRRRRSSARTSRTWTRWRRTCARGWPRRARGGGEEAVQRQREQGKLLARERVERLLDPGTPFLEIGALAAHGLYDGAAPSRGPGHRHRARARPRGDGRRQRRHREGRHLLPDDGEEAPARAGDRARRTACPASTSWTRAAPSCPCRPRSSPTATTSAASSTTRRA